MVKITEEASGKNRIKKVEDKLFAKIPEEFFTKKAKEVVLDVIGDEKISLHDVNNIADSIFEIVDPNANIAIDAFIDEKMKDWIRVSLILGL